MYLFKALPDLQALPSGTVCVCVCIFPRKNAGFRHLLKLSKGSDSLCKTGVAPDGDASGLV